MKIKINLDDYEFEEELWDVCRDYIALYTDTSELCDIGQAIDLKFNLTGNVVAEEIRIRNFWKDKDYEIKDTLVDNMVDELFAKLCAEYGIVILNLNELYWDYKEYLHYE